MKKYYEYRQSYFPQSTWTAPYEKVFLFKWGKPVEKSGDIDDAAYHLIKSNVNVIQCRGNYLYKDGDIWYRLSPEKCDFDRLYYSTEYDRYVGAKMYYKRER